MKLKELFISFVLVISFIPLYADDAVTPDSEPAAIDLDAIKKDILLHKSKKSDEGKIVKPAKSESGKKKGKAAKGGKTKKSAAKSAVKPGKAVTGKKGVSKEKKAVIKKGKPLPASGEKDIKKGQGAVKTAGAGSKKGDSALNRGSAKGKIDILSGSNVLTSGKDAIADKKNTSTGELPGPDSAGSITGDMTIQPEIKDTVIINPLNSEITGNRLQFISYEEIARFWKFKRVQVAEDSGPVLDNIAFYMPAYSAVFKVGGYDRELNYRLALDIVKFRSKPGPLNSLLKIWGRNSAGRMFLLAELNENNLTDKKIFETLIPYELSYPGSFDIIVKEYSDLPGRWGIWDVIITARRIDQIETVKPDTSVKMKETELKIFK